MWKGLGTGTIPSADTDDWAYCTATSVEIGVSNITVTVGSQNFG